MKLEKFYSNSIIAFFFISQFIYIQNISIISSSSIEKCINASPNEDISCKSKMLLSLTIQNAELEGSDYVETILNQVTDNDGNIQKFSSPIKITFSKTPVKVIYPCIYFQDFNYEAQEIIIETSSTKCTDSNLSENPTCGWKYSNGKKIPNSQGFCCSCSFFSLSKMNKRGSKCTDIIEFTSTAHCLKFHEVWFSAYQVDKYKIEYIITIKVINTFDNSTISTLELSPQNTIAINEDKNILVKLIGDFLPTDIFPRDLSNKYFLIPSEPSENPIVKSGVGRYMLIDKNRFTLDGNECDKIGVGYNAFNLQSERCNAEVNSCLRNQISHLYEEDLKKLIKGNNPDYLIAYDKNYHYTFKKENSYSRSFSYKLNGNINTLITLEIDTSIMKFVTSVSSGKIIKAFINSGFMAMSDDGFMLVSIKNTGLLTAQYFVSYECSENILPLSSDEISLTPDEIKAFNKSLYTNINLGVIHKCFIILKNSIGEEIDNKLVIFNTTNEINFNNQLNKSHDNTNINYGSSKEYICEELCINFFDFFCYFKNSCWEIFITKILIIVGLILIFSIIFKCFKKSCSCRKCIKSLLCFMFCCCKSKKSKEKDKKIKASNDDSEMDNYD